MEVSRNRGGNIFIQEPSMEDLKRRRRTRSTYDGDEEDHHDRYEKKKCVVRDDANRPFGLKLVLISARTVDDSYPTTALLRPYYVVAWFKPGSGFETRPCGCPPQWNRACFTDVVEPGWQYLFLELVRKGGLNDDDPGSSTHETVVGRARLQLQNFRCPGRARFERVRVPLVQVYGGAQVEGGGIKFEERWEIMLEIYTTDIIHDATRDAGFVV